MNVLLVSAEMDPFAKVGGLADVIGSLPKALRAIGIDARVLLPLYGFIDTAYYHIEPLFTYTVSRRDRIVDVTIYTTTHDGVNVYFLYAPPFFGDEKTVYSDVERDAPRFIFFCQAVIDFLDVVFAQDNYKVDVVHANDWHTGLVPFLAQTKRETEPNWATLGTMLGIHNMAYQGDRLGGYLWEAGVPGRLSPLLLGDQHENMLAIAIVHSDVVTTVSPRYAIEIQYPYAGYGLDGLIRARVDDLYGILNGIDTDLWNPATDTQIVAPFDAQTFVMQRAENKRQLQAESGLEVRPNVLLIGMVTRLVWQKGLDLAVPALRWMLAGQDVQFVALGSGEPEYNEQIFRVGHDFFWKAKTFIGYNAAVAQRIYAGCDLFLMPSHYEPCGVGQMIAMRYGALPLVRETGGLADTVENYDGGSGDVGTGFRFSWETVEALYSTMTWALETYRARPDAWQRMQARAMAVDHSWTRSANTYRRLYERIVGQGLGVRG